MQRKLTARTVAALKPPASGRLEVWDSTLPGFGIRLTANGAASWVMMYRHEGVKRRLTLGSYPRIKLAAARDFARKHMEAVAAGRDPAAEKARARVARAVTFKDLAVAYIERYAKANKRTWAEDEDKLEKHVLPRWKGRKPEGITRADVIELLEGVATNAPIAANRVRAMLSKLFGWAVDKDMLQANPVAGVRKPSTERSRDRVLSDAELAEVWAAAAKVAAPFGDCIRAMILTAQRRGEVSTLRDADLDDPKSPTLWTIPREVTKADRVHGVPVVPAVAGILSAQPRFKDGIYVFTTTGGRRPISGWSKAKAALDEKLLGARRDASADAAPMLDWRLHDLRRTAASGMARMGFPPHVVSAVLNHAPATTQGITAVYNRHRYTDEKRAALEAWAAHVAANMADNVMAAA